jgi:hypothetical protein
MNIKKKEVKYKRNFNVYMEVYLDFVYESLPITLEDNFVKFDME